MLKSGDNNQKEAAAGALCDLSVNHDNQIAIARAGSIPLLVNLEKSGNDRQKEHAAGALQNLSLRYSDKIAIARADGKQSLRSLLCNLL